MAVDSDLAAIHFRIEAAGASVEAAIDALRNRRVFQGRVAVMRAVSEIQRAAGYARDSGKYPALLAGLTALAAWYQSEGAKIIRPSAGPTVAGELHAAQGTLLGMDPAVSAPVPG